MVEFDRTLEREAPPADNLKICVVGVGGGGLNVLDRISLDRMLDATVVAMHTDVRVLTHSMSPAKIQLGAEVMCGIGCGGDPELGREAAIASREKIRAAIDGHNMVFICCGLGGGTGSGAAPVVARLAKESGALVFVFATTPFVFEGRRRLNQAEAAMSELQKHADSLILFENNRMGELVLPKEGIQKAFSQADQLIGHSVRAIATMVTQPGIVRMGLADLMTALNSPNARCLFGFGEARGANRVAEALKRSLKSPLVNQGELLQNARNLLVHVAGGESLTLAEVESLMKQLGKCVPDSTQIMFGLAVDPRMGDAIALTLVSSLSAQEMTTKGKDQEVVSEQVVESVKSKSDEEVKALEPTTPVAPATTPAPATAVAPTNEVTAKVEKVEAAPARQEPVQVEQALPEVKVEQVRVSVEGVERDLFGEKIAAAAEAESAVEKQPEAASSVAIEPAAAVPQAQVRIVIPPVEAEAEVEVAPAKVETAKIKVNVAAKAPDEGIESVEVQEPVSAPAAEAATVVAKKSIFEVVDDDEGPEAEEEEIRAENFNHKVEVESNGAHWADKYSQSTAQVEHKKKVVQTTAQQQLEPALSGVAKTSASNGNGSASAFKQANFNLSQEDAGRFKGTTKTIVEGEDLDVPTWMRLKK